MTTLLYSRWILVPCGIGLAIAAFLASRSTYAIDLTVAPHAEDHMRIVCKERHVDKTETASLLVDLHAQILDQDGGRVQAVTARIGAENDERRYDSGPFPVGDNGLVNVSVRLGSEERPVTKIDVYTFELFDAKDGRSLISGVISARFTHVAGPSVWFVAPLNLFAALIQVGQAVAGAFNRRRTSPALPLMSA
jgi:hypothetical protein